MEKMVQEPKTREERREQVLQELREMANRLATSGRPASVAEMEAFFQKAEELPLAGRSLEYEAARLQPA